MDVCWGRDAGWAATFCYAATQEAVQGEVRKYLLLLWSCVVLQARLLRVDRVFKATQGLW